MLHSKLQILNTYLKKHSRIAAILVIFSIVVVAFIIRYQGVTYGLELITELNYPPHQDEPTFVDKARDMILLGDPNPYFFNYPTLYIYLQAAVQSTVYLSGKLFGNFVRFFDVNIVNFYFWGRILTVVLSTCTALLIYLIGSLLFNKLSAIFAALFLTFAHLHIFNSYLITSDSPMAFWVVFSFYISTLIYVRGAKIQYYIINAVLIGFAIGTKYTAVWCAIPLIFAHILSTKKEGMTILDRKIIIALLLIPIAFFISTPYSVLDYSSFMRDVSFESLHYSYGHLSAESEFTSHGFYVGALFKKFGAVPFIFSILGLIILSRKDFSEFLFLISFPIIYLIFVGMYRAHFDRNMVVMIPFLALTAGYAVAVLIKFLGKKRISLKLNKLNVTIIILLISIILLSLYTQTNSALNHIRILHLTDTKLLAKNWIENNIPDGSTIIREHATPPLDNSRYNVQRVGYLGQSDDKYENYDFIMVSSYSYSQFINNEQRFPRAAGRYNEIFSSYELLQEIKADYINSSGPTIRILKNPL